MNCTFLRRGYGKIELPPKIMPNFADNEWSAIIYACQNNLVPSTWVVGNNKTMDIGGTSYQIDIIGKNHDTYSDGSGTAPLTFQMHNCYNTAYAMNSSDTNVGGWTNCDMRTKHLPAILALMPPEVQEGIKEVNKLTSAGNQSATIVTTSDKLFLLSEFEVFGSTTNSASGEGKRYSYYTTYNDTDYRVKKVAGGSANWWERSPKKDRSNYFCNVSVTGRVSYYYPTSAYGVAFAFCF